MALSSLTFKMVFSIISIFCFLRKMSSGAFFNLVSKGLSKRMVSLTLPMVLIRASLQRQAQEAPQEPTAEPQASLLGWAPWDCSDQRAGDTSLRCPP